MTNADAVALLATTTGIAGILVLILNAVRRYFTPEAFSRFAPLLAMVLGVLLAFLGAFATINPLTTTALIGALVSGILAGALSQNVNTAVQRLLNPPTPTP